MEFAKLLNVEASSKSRELSIYCLNSSLEYWVLPVPTTLILSGSKLDLKSLNRAGKMRFLARSPVAPKIIKIVGCFLISSERGSSMSYFNFTLVREKNINKYVILNYG